MKTFLIVFVAIVCWVVIEETVAADPVKPVWPLQFDTVFGLNCKTCKPAIQNETSHFYYDWKLQSQVIDYPTTCLPGLVSDSQQYPCTMWFNPDGIYFQQLAQKIGCCSLFPGVGAVPPNFLRGFHYSNVENATDYYGASHACNHWTSGITFFGYWTQLHTGDDIQFKDGPSGVFWNFAPFNVAPQNPSIFDLPTNQGNCSQLCTDFPGFQIDPVCCFFFFHSFESKCILIIIIFLHSRI